MKKLISDEDLETCITLRVPGTDYDKVSSIGKRTKQVLVIGVFTEDEFLDFDMKREFEGGMNDDES